ncbi:TRAP transporter small permease [Marispirochaeta sp.]|jgi:TRAP-type transport system small permease protein|uniref:TRAP transporter small permease n=1 Tax=Marispirochaeta sp. TaxID=2038653 RepID=UPI0029C7965B|nr:TRAP transporter small permease [Marispirochaeta sp.]
MLQGIVRFFNLLHVLLVVLAKILLVVMVLTIFANVVLRYGFSSGLQWSEELGLLMAVWFSFIAMVLGVKQNLHIHINLLPENKLPPLVDKILRKINDLVIIFVGCIFLRWGIPLVAFTMRSILPASHLPAGWLYMIMPVSAVFLVYEGLVDLLGINTEDEAVDGYLLGTVSLKQILKGDKHG